MDSKRYRDAADDEPASAGKRVRLNDVASAALAGSNAMQAVAHEALARSNGAGFTAINKGRPPAATPASQQHPPLQPQHLQHPQQQLQQQQQKQPLASTPDHRRNSSSNANTGSRISDSANRVVMASPAGHYSRNGASSTPAPGPADKSSGSLDTITDITRRFRSAVNKGWSRRSPTYNTVDVMLIYWEDDEAEVKNSVLNLQAAFYGSLNYPTELCTIRSSESSHIDIRAKVEHFFARDQSLDRLAILYYAGQCVSSDSPDSQALFLVPYVSPSPSPPSLLVTLLSY